MTERKKMSQGERLCWILACMLIATIVTMHAEAVAKQPGECSLTAMAALKVAQTPQAELVPYVKHRVDLMFVRFSKFIWHHARGDENQFLRWYRIACEQGRVPRYYRVVDGAMVRGNGA